MLNFSEVILWMMNLSINLCFGLFGSGWQFWCLFF